MNFLPGGDMSCEKKELRLFVIVTVLIWLKFFAVDYNIAAVLDWPIPLLVGGNTVGHILRALAVSLPSLCAILCLVAPVSLLPSRIRAASLRTLDFLLSVLVV